MGLSEGNMSALLNSLLVNYDNRLRPNFGGKHVVVTVGFWILSIDEINVMDMDYRMDFFLRQLWHDPRLKHSFNGTLALGNYMMDKIWVPDTYFENSKSSSFHKVTTVNKMLTITSNGDVHYNSRITATASCPMDLRMFPIDIQECGLNIESYGYNADEMVYKWEDRIDNGIAVNKKTRDMPQYNLTKITAKRIFTMYFSGNWSRLSAHFQFQRRSGYFFIHIYGPCALIVIISWISFCIPPESTAARIALGITSVLTITTILNMLNNSMPKVAYVKAIDWYLIGCFLFVFGVLFEYTLVLYIDNVHNRRHRRRMKKRKKIDDTDELDEYRPLTEDFQTPSTRNRSHQNGHCHQNGGLPNGFQSSNQYSTVYVKPRQRKDTEFEKKPNKPKRSFLCRITCRDLINSECLDSYSRVLFPLSFAVFNAVYWLVFMQFIVVEV
ncbi:Gamma-aminobutyric acid receptor subunit beta [Exaiptasia diaphana]|nr:Gamma-aminobutyric acid receptor subunit beta [Exaiptasia diaphana]